MIWLHWMDLERHRAFSWLLSYRDFYSPSGENLTHYSRRIDQKVIIPASTQWKVDHWHNYIPYNFNWCAFLGQTLLIGRQNTSALLLCIISATPQSGSRTGWLLDCSAHIPDPNHYATVSMVAESYHRVFTPSPYQTSPLMALVVLPVSRCYLMVLLHWVLCFLLASHHITLWVDLISTEWMPLPIGKYSGPFGVTSPNWGLAYSP